jgi:hypothetical protein
MNSSTLPIEKGKEGKQKFSFGFSIERAKY